VKSRVAEQIKNNIREHISRFPNVESHYCRKESQRMYLDKTLSLRRMYRLYVEECNTLNSPVQKFWLYEKIFNTEFNLGFHRPKKDLCALCETFKFLSKDDQDIKRAQFDLHQQRKRDARNQKSADKEKAQTSDRNKYRVLNFDLQKVLLSPKTDVGDVYYSRKLTTYTLSVFDLVSKEAVFYVV